MPIAARAVPLLFVCCAAGVHAQDYAAWNKVNLDGSWTRTAEAAVRATTLATLVPKDIDTFCPRYASRDAEERTRFWVGLLSAMAQPESNFKLSTKYVEPDIRDAHNQNVVSRGLLQISMESANQAAYDCAIKNAQDLHEVDVNLHCAARIMQHWVRKEGRIAAPSRPVMGAARYWSVLRGAKKHLGAITEFTRKMAVCKP